MSSSVNSFNNKQDGGVKFSDSGSNRLQNLFHNTSQQEDYLAVNVYFLRESGISLLFLQT